MKGLNKSDSFTFQVIEPDRSSKILQIKKAETIESLYQTAFVVFGKKCKLYSVNEDTMQETLLERKNITLETFILNKPHLFTHEKQKGLYKLYFYEDYYENHNEGTSNFL